MARSIHGFDSFFQFRGARSLNSKRPRSFYSRIFPKNILDILASLPRFLRILEASTSLCVSASFCVGTRSVSSSSTESRDVLGALAWQASILSPRDSAGFHDISVSSNPLHQTKYLSLGLRYFWRCTFSEKSSSTCSSNDVLPHINALCACL